MPILSWTELQRLTRAQLFKLLAMLIELLAGNTLSASERESVQTNMRNVKTALARTAAPRP